MSSAKKTITLKTADGEVFEVEEAVAMEFAAIGAFFEENTNPGESRVVPLPNVSARPLETVMEYCREQVALRERSAEKKEIEAYAGEFVRQKSNEELKEMILVTNYLNIRGLHELLIETVAARIQNKGVEYVRHLFGVDNDFNPQEEANIRHQHPWAFEGVDLD